MDDGWGVEVFHQGALAISSGKLNKSTPLSLLMDRVRCICIPEGDSCREKLGLALIYYLEIELFTIVNI